MLYYYVYCCNYTALYKAGFVIQCFHDTTYPAPELFEQAHRRGVAGKAKVCWKFWTSMEPDIQGGWRVSDSTRQACGVIAKQDYIAQE